MNGRALQDLVFATQAIVRVMLQLTSTHACFFRWQLSVFRRIASMYCAAPSFPSFTERRSGTPAVVSFIFSCEISTPTFSCSFQYEYSRWVRMSPWQNTCYSCYDALPRVLSPLLKIEKGDGMNNTSLYGNVVSCWSYCWSHGLSLQVLLWSVGDRVCYDEYLNTAAIQLTVLVWLYACVDDHLHAHVRC